MLEFKKVTLASRDHFREYYYLSSPYVVNTFIQNFLWASKYGFYNNLFIIKKKEGSKNRNSYSLSKGSFRSEDLTLLYELGPINDTPEEIVLHLQQVTPHTLFWERHPEEDEYVFDLSQAGVLQGSSTKKIRKILQRFDFKYGKNTNFKELNLQDGSDVNLVCDLFYLWHQAKKDASQQERVLRLQEMHAFETLRTHLKSFPTCKAVGLFYKCRLMAFTIFELDSCKKLAYSIFSKALRELPGTSETQHIFRINFLISSGMRYLNIDSSMGLKGLSYYKGKWPGVAALKKYKLLAKPS